MWKCNEKGKRKGISKTIKVVTLNVSGISTKREKLVNKLNNIEVDITPRNNEETLWNKHVGIYRIFYSGVKQEKRASNGIAIYLLTKGKNSIKYYTWVWGERTLTLTLEGERKLYIL